jgi:hypothetical protein
MSIVNYVIHDASGAINQWGVIPEDMMDLQIQNHAMVGKSIIKGVGHPHTHYVKDGESTLRPDNPTTLNGGILSNLPVPSVIQMDDGTTYDVNDSTVELSFPNPGQYAVTVISFPFLPKTFGIQQ